MSRLDGDVVVVGAGLIGLAIAFELAERGAIVRVYDRSEPGRGASWAGAGMLAPYTERVQAGALLTFCARSLGAYPAFVQRVFDASGIDSKLRLDGVLHAAFDETGTDALLRLARDLAAAAVPCETLDRSAMLSEAPWLATSVLGGLFVHGEGHVDNRRLGRALATACAALGVRIERDATVAVECDRRRALGLRTSRGFVPAAVVVNACGAWSARLAGVPESCAVPIEPVKGQMLALAAPVSLVRHATWLPNVYAVPRDDGRLLIGATSESAGYDERVTARGVERLLAAALAAAPSLDGLTLTESWAGLRPATPDGLPFIGPTAIDGYVLATGHYRNGILLAPATARAIADLIEIGASDDVRPFSLARLGTEVESAERITHA